MVSLGQQVGTQINGQIRVSSKSYWASVTLEELPGHEAFRISMYDPDIPNVAGQWHELNELNVDVLPMPFTAGVVEIVSASASDAAAGTGVQSITIDGIDAAGARQIEIVTLNGTTPVQTTGSYTHINIAYAETIGSAKSAVGNITFQSVGGGTVYTRITAGEAMTRHAKFLVPTGKQLIVIEWLASDASKETLLQLQTTMRPDGIVGDAWISTGEQIVTQESAHMMLVMPLVVKAGGLIRVVGTDLKNKTGQVSSLLSMVLEDAD